MKEVKGRFSLLEPYISCVLSTVSKYTLGHILSGVNCHNSIEVIVALSQVASAEDLTLYLLTFLFISLIFSGRKI